MTQAIQNNSVVKKLKKYKGGDTIMKIKALIYKIFKLTLICIVIYTTNSTLASPVVDSFAYAANAVD
ncbi:hypothetical protein [Methanococcoides seepicolus]|uniref:Uncharacterized protein n=1 Tax=Methanococcoides seepicolus TaxID=2828780 RepID=A0A9E4ZGV1_9EURY|nr:hypothetical protein [Methanococcoides seepicolus]MCM1987831.1 hypothetical protein [Methanococcoides seepicolus]